MGEKSEGVSWQKCGVSQMAYHINAFVFYHINRQTSTQKVEIPHENIPYGWELSDKKAESTAHNYCLPLLILV